MTRGQIGAAPVNPSDAATKAYVDAQIGTLSPTAITAVDHGALAWTSDPQTTQTTVPTLGSVYGTLFRAAATGTCTKMVMYCSTAQSTPTAIYVGLFDTSGNQLGISANVNTAFQTTGQKTIALATSVPLVAGQKYVACLLVVGGTAPTIVATVGSTAPSLNMTVGTSAPLRQMKTSSTARTTFNNPEVWTGYAVVGNAPLQLMTI